MAFWCFGHKFSRRSSKVTTTEGKNVSEQDETADNEQPVLHHHFHKHHHLHHHTISSTVQTASAEDIKSPEDWLPEYPWLTSDFYDDKGQVNTRRSPSTEQEDVEARVFFRVIAPLWQHSYLSTVFEAKFRITGDTVMLKMINKDNHTGSRQLILAEQRVMAITQESFCPFIASLYSSFQTQKHCFLVMEFASGGQLSKLMEHVERFYESVATFYIAEIALGMFFLHQNRVVIRGLTTANVLLGKDGHVRLCDLSWCAENVGAGDLIQGVVVGEFHNTPPEMLHDTLYTRAVDYWALGIILYRMVMGKNKLKVFVQCPFSRKTRVELFKAITSDREGYDSSLQNETVDLCRSLLTKAQKQRLGYAEGAEEQFKNHHFFDKLSWLKLEMRLYSPPYIPEDDDMDALTSPWLYLMDREMLMKTSSMINSEHETVSKASSTDAPRVATTHRKGSQGTPRGSLESPSTLLDTRRGYLSPEGGRQGRQSELGECSKSFESELASRKRNLNTAQEGTGARVLDRSARYGKRRMSAQAPRDASAKRSPPSSPEDSCGPEDNGAIGPRPASKDSVGRTASMDYALSALRRATSTGETLDLKNLCWIRERAMTRQDLVELAPEWEHWRNPRRSTFNSISKHTEKKKKTPKCVPCACTPDGCKLCCRRCWESFRHRLATKAARCKIICCGPEENDYEPATDEKGLLPTPPRGSKDRSALDAPRYSVDVFREINTAKVSDASNPGEWIGLGSKDMSTPRLSSRPPEANPKEDRKA